MKQVALESIHECGFFFFKPRNYFQRGLKKPRAPPLQTVPLRHMWPEVMVFAVIPNPHIYNMRSVYRRRGYKTGFMDNVQILTIE